MAAIRPRLSIDVSPRQQRFLEKLPHGWKQQLFSTLLDMLIDMVDRCGFEALGVIASKAIKLENYFDPENE